MLEDPFYFGFASIPNNTSPELDPYKTTEVKWKTDAQPVWYAPERVEIGFLANPPAPTAGDIVVAVNG